VKIHILSDEMASRIAAGEVVERPASVVKELIENSLDSGATEISISIEKSGTTLIRVADNGEGIAEADIKRIFSVFESRKGSRGTGLGLPVSQKIMREHGGDIRVESTPNHGSRFFLQLPAQPPQTFHNTDTISIETLKPMKGA